MGFNLNGRTSVQGVAGMPIAGAIGGTLVGPVLLLAGRVESE